MPNLLNYFKKLSISKLPLESTKIVTSSQSNDSFTLHLSQSSTSSINSLLSLSKDDDNDSSSNRVPQMNNSNDPALSQDEFNTTMKPIRPTISKYTCNEKGNKFNPQWYTKYTWLEYSLTKNSAYCFVCRHFGENNSKKKNTFTHEGFTDFRKAAEKLKLHNDCQTHKTSTLLYLNRLSKAESCASQLDSQHAKKVKENRGFLANIIETVMFLAKQGLALRGNDESSVSLNRGNFLELINFQCNYNEELKRAIDQKTFTYTSKTIQNELIEIISNEIIKLLMPSNLKYFAIMVDETTDLGRHEQVSICIRYIDDNLTIKENFVGFFKTDSTTAKSLCRLVLTALENFGLDYKSKLVGQCYDGAANMSGLKNGLNKKIREKAKKALYIHCYAHQLNLALMHSCNNIKHARNCLDTLNSLHSFIEGSAKRHSLFQLIQDKSNATILKHLSDTRWGSRSSSLDAMKDSFSSVIKFLDIVDTHENNDTGAKASGLLRQVKNFDFLFHVHILQALFKKTGILHTSLQCSSLDINTALDLAEICIQSLIEMKLDVVTREALFETILKFANENDIETPSNSNQVGRPSNEKKRKRMNGSENPLEKYIDSYQTILDIFIDHLSEKFQIDNYKPLVAISNILTANKKPEIGEMFFDLVIYREDIDIDKLDTELQTWLGYKLKFNLNDIQSIHTHFTEKKSKISVSKYFCSFVNFSNCTCHVSRK